MDTKISVIVGGGDKRAASGPWVSGSAQPRRARKLGISSRSMEDWADLSHRSTNLDLPCCHKKEKASSLNTRPIGKVKAYTIRNMTTSL